MVKGVPNLHPIPNDTLEQDRTKFRRLRGAVTGWMNGFSPFWRAQLCVSPTRRQLCTACVQPTESASAHVQVAAAAAHAGHQWRCSAAAVGCLCRDWRSGRSVLSLLTAQLNVATQLKADLRACLSHCLHDHHCAGQYVDQQQALLAGECWSASGTQQESRQQASMQPPNPCPCRRRTILVKSTMRVLALPWVDASGRSGPCCCMCRGRVSAALMNHCAELSVRG